MLTAWCALVVLGSGFFFGLPLAWLLKGRKPLEEDDWLFAPFLGVSGVVLVLENGVLLERTIAAIAPLLWLLGGGLWLWMLGERWRAHQGEPNRSRWSLGQGSPWRLCLAVALVYLVHGMGLFTVGARAYLGRAQSDQYNYTSLAQFFVEFPYSTSWDAIGQRPYLVDGMRFKGDRIGVMLLQGFFGTSTLTDAKTVFAPTILLCPALVVVAVYGLGRRLGQGSWQALATATAAGAFPGLASLHLDCFLSHAVVVPFVLASLLALHDVARAPGPGRAIHAALLLACATALYTEFAPILAGLTVLCLAGGVLLGTLRWWQGLCLLGVVPGLSVAFNPLAWDRILTITGRVQLAKDHFNPLSYLWSLRGLGALWVNDIWAFDKGWLGATVLVFSVAMSVLAVLGLGKLGWRLAGLLDRPTRADRSYREGCLLVLGILALAGLPLAVLLYNPKLVYQSIKLLLTAGPLLVVGVAHAWDRVPLPLRWFPARAQPTIPTGVGRVLGWTSLTALLLVTLVGTGNATRQSASEDIRFLAGQPSGFSTLQHLVHARFMRSVIDKLGSLKGQNLVLACGGGFLWNGWLSYAARNNAVWLVNPLMNDGIAFGLDSLPPGSQPALVAASVGKQLTDLRGVPPEALLLTAAGAPQVLIEGVHHLVWTNGVFQLWQLGPEPYTLRRTEASLLLQ